MSSSTIICPPQQLPLYYGTYRKAAWLGVARTAARYFTHAIYTLLFGDVPAVWTTPPIKSTWAPFTPPQETSDGARLALNDDLCLSFSQFLERPAQLTVEVSLVPSVCSKITACSLFPVAEDEIGERRAGAAVHCTGMCWAQPTNGEECRNQKMVK